MEGREAVESTDGLTERQKPACGAPAGSARRRSACPYAGDLAAHAAAFGGRRRDGS